MTEERPKYNAGAGMSGDRRRITRDDLKAALARLEARGSVEDVNLVRGYVHMLESMIEKQAYGWRS
jgi:hypothetical protein